MPLYMYMFALGHKVYIVNSTKHTASLLQTFYFIRVNFLFFTSITVRNDRQFVGFKQA